MIERDRVEAWRHRSHPIWLYRLVQIALGWLVRFLFRTERIGHQKIPRDGQVILASNHASYIDPILVVACIPRAVFHVGKLYLFQNRYLNFLLETLGGQIPLDRDRDGNIAALDAGLIVLNRGLALGIYPEGTRTLDGKLLRGKTGVALFAFHSGAPIYPVAIEGTFRIWPRGRFFPRLFSRTRIIVGDPIRVPMDPSGAANPRRCVELTTHVMKALGGLLHQEYAPGERRKEPA